MFNFTKAIAVICLITLFSFVEVNTVEAHQCEKRADQTATQKTVFRRYRRQCADANSRGRCLNRRCSTRLNNNGECQGRDCDLDGVRKVGDNCSMDENPDQADADNDTVGDACDNCVSDTNADQADADNDNTGDVCETTCDVVIGEVENGRMFVYRNVLNNGGDSSPTPDAVLTSPGGHPRVIDIEDDIMVNCSRDGDVVEIWDGVSTLATGDMPDVSLNLAVSGIDDCRSLDLFGGDLYVGNIDGDTVRIFNDVPTIITGGVPVAPDVILDMGTSGIDNPNGLIVAPNGTLFVANDDADTVTGYSAATLSSGAGPHAPDVTLNFAASFLDEPHKLAIENDCLLVFNQADFNYGTDVAAFCPLGSITTNEAPATGFKVFAARPMSAVEVGGRLWFGQNGGPGVVAFNDPDNINGIPDVMMGDSVTACISDSEFSATMPNMVGTDVVRACGGHLFGVSGGNCFTHGGMGSGWAYADPATVTSDQFPDIFFSSPGMSFPKGLAVQERS